MDIAVDGSRALVASNQFGLSEIIGLDSNIASVAASASVESVSNVPFAGTQIALSDNAAVVTGQKDGMAHLWVLDVSETLPQPTVTGELSSSIPANQGSTGFLDVTAGTIGSRSYAFVAAGTSGVKIVDITDPRYPSLTATYATANAYGVAFESARSLLYVADTSAGLQIVNVSSPGRPLLVGSFKLAGAIYRDIEVSTGMAYLADQSGTITVVDVTLASAPRFVSRATLLGFGLYIAVDGNTKRAAVVSKTSTVSAQYENLEIFDISGTTPRRIASRGSALETPSGTFMGVALANGSVYTAGGKGVQIYQADNLSIDPEKVAVAGSAADISVTSTYAYVAGYPAILSIMLP